MNADRVSVAIVGCGRIAGLGDGPRPGGQVTTHAQAYTRHPAFCLDAIAEPDRVRREAFQAGWGIPRAYASLEDLLLNERPAVVSVCSNTPQHFDHLRTLLSAAGVRVVFAEKPVCEMPAEMQELQRLAAADAAPAVLVNHTRRFDAAHRGVADLVRGGALGALVAGRCDYYGGWLNNGSHLVDTLRMIVGDLSLERAASGGPGRPGDPCLDVRLSGAGAPIDVFGFDESMYQLFELDLRFSAGRILIRDFGEQIIVEHVTTNEIGERFLTAAAGSPWRGMESPLAHAADAVAAHLDGRRPLASTGATLDDAAATMGVLWEAMAQV